MQGDDAGAQAAAARARDLQPAGCPDDAGLGEPVPTEVFLAAESRPGLKASRLQESIDRRLADQGIVQLLAKNGFAGSQYDRFVDELVRYSVSVLRAWMHSGFIFKLVAKRGFGLNPHELELEQLNLNSDLREELATMTVARALPRFRQQAFIEGGWRFEGRASITTYFMGACAYDFPNEFRRWRTEEEKQSRALHRLKQVCEDPVGTLSVADEVLGKLRVLNDLKNTSDPRTRAAVAMTLDGYSQEEIREVLGAETVRAVEGLLYRWRIKMKQDEEGGRRG